MSVLLASSSIRSFGDELQRSDLSGVSVLVMNETLEVGNLNLTPLSWLAEYRTSSVHGSSSKEDKEV